jgi:hypothetical protein
MEEQRRWLASALLLVGLAAPAAADSWKDKYTESGEKKALAERLATPRMRHWPWVHDEAQAGYPSSVACYAHLGETPAYVGYYVGGGSALGGSPRYCCEGTWGWDYQSHCLPRRVLLYWSHGHRSQGGTGDYRTAGGPEVPDLPGLLNPQLYGRPKHGHHEEAEHE